MKEQKKIEQLVVYKGHKEKVTLGKFPKNKRTKVAGPAISGDKEIGRKSNGLNFGFL